METLAERIKIALERSGKTQADLVRATKAKSSSVSNWVNGRTKNLKGSNLTIAAQVLGVSEAWLGAGVGPMERQIPDRWPFSAPYSAYEALDESQKKMLDGIVTAFIDNAVPAAKSTTKKEAA